jgi:16S rRNA (uracil1498-N3)-methyltransferase
MIRLLIEVPAGPPGSLWISGEPFHYLSHVLRLRPGAALEVFDGHGRRFEARLQAYEEGRAQLCLGPLKTERPERPVVLVQGLCKGDKLDWIVEKATELGVAEIRPVRARRSVVQLDAVRGEQKVQRWRRIAEAAARQCGRATVPIIAQVAEVAAAAAFPSGAHLLLLDEQALGPSLGDAVSAQANEPGPVVLFVGPEGGWDREEVKTLADRGALPVTLGHLILRAETAALAALVVARERLGTLG